MTTDLVTITDDMTTVSMTTEVRTQVSHLYIAGLTSAMRVPLDIVLLKHMYKLMVFRSE